MIRRKCVGWDVQEIGFYTSENCTGETLVPEEYVESGHY
jgi:hypothetical protein